MNIAQKHSTEKNYILVNKIEKAETAFSTRQQASSQERIFSSAELWNIRRKSTTGVARRRFL